MPEFRYAQMTCLLSCIRALETALRSRGFSGSGVPSSCFHVLGRRPETQPAAKRELRQVWSCCQAGSLEYLVRFLDAEVYHQIDQGLGV